MRICSLASGSKGNSLFIESDHTRVLIDAGLSTLQLSKRLKSIDIEPETINAIALTHAHNDHVRGAGVFARHYNTPVYGHPDTLDDIAYLFKRIETIIPWKEPFMIGDLNFKPFPVSHDAFPTVGYIISVGRKSVTICTDLGIVTPEVLTHLALAQFLIIESNHDPDMLMNGPYSWELKERIASRVGHLSNQDTGLLLTDIYNGRIQKILLAHLSDENNTPELAKNTVLEFIGQNNQDVVEVIKQNKVSSIYNF